MQPGPHGDGAALLFELMAHMTRPEFVYVHEWTRGDLLVWDNRCLAHAATWFDAEKEKRLMWRTTVSGNPGTIYAGEARSWIPAQPVNRSPLLQGEGRRLILAEACRRPHRAAQAMPDRAYASR